MALTSTDANPVRSGQTFGWAVQMQDDKGNLYRVLVSDEALQDLASPPDASISRLNDYRSRMEQAASAKLKAGQIEPDQTIRVTSADLG